MYHIYINIYNMYQCIIYEPVYGDASQLKRKILENPIKNVTSLNFYSYPTSSVVSRSFKLFSVLKSSSFFLTM